MLLLIANEIKLKSKNPRLVIKLAAELANLDESKKVAKKSRLLKVMYEDD